MIPDAAMVALSGSVSNHRSRKSAAPIVINWTKASWWRWGSDEAVLLLWQADYDTPLIPGADRRTALRLEKAIERLAMLPVDFANQPDQQVRRARTLPSAA